MMIKSFFDMLTNRFRSRNLRFDILSSFFVLQVITAISIVTYTYVNNSRSIVDFSNRLMENASISEVASIADNFREVMTSTELGGYLVQETSKAAVISKDLIQFMMGHCRQYKLVDSVYVGTESGYFVQVKPITPGTTYRIEQAKILPKKAVFALRIVDRSDVKPTEVWIYLDNEGKKIDEEKIPEAQITMVHKNRPWYIKTAQNRSNIWTDIFVSDVTQSPSIACGVPLLSDTGDFVGVISSTVGLPKLAVDLQKSDIKGVSMVLNQKGEIVAHPTEKNYSKVVGTETKLVTIDDLTDKTASVAYRAKQIDKQQRFIFTSGDVEYIALFKEFLLEGFKGWEFLMITPIDEYIGVVKVTQRNTLLICLMILILSIVVIAVMARRIAAPINNLSLQADKITNFDLEPVVEVVSGIKEIQKLQNSISRMRKSLISFGKFVPKNLVKKLVDKGVEVKIGGKKKQLSIFFSDIANFTTISETYPPEKLVLHLYEYFDEMTSIVAENNGTTDKYIGDAIMAFWGAPQQDNAHSLNCCLTALLCQKRLLDLNRKWVFEKKPEFLTRIGIHTGEVIVGNIGSSERMNYTIIGDSVNLAARLEGANKAYGTNIMLSEATVHHLHDHAVVRPLDIVAVKGKNEGVTIYELVALKNSNPLVLPSDDQLKFCNEFTKAFRFYLEQRWDEALTIFHDLQRIFGQDDPCELYIERCEAFKKTPPPADWDGVYHMKTK
jgi:adenylate cyclase